MFLPTVAGDGNFVVCVTDRFENKTFKTIRVPAGVIFQATGKLRAPLVADSDKADIENLNDKEPPAAAVVVKGVSLTPTARCGKVEVEMVVSESWRFTEDHLAVSDQVVFEADGLSVARSSIYSEARLLNPKGSITNHEYVDNGSDDQHWSELENAMNSGALRGAATQDITRSTTPLPSTASN